MAKHVMVPPPSLREKVPTLSPAVEQVVMTALAKDPRQRFGQVHAFATALEQASQVEVSQAILASRSPQPTDAPTTPSPSHPSPELIASVSQSSIPTELVTPVSQSFIPTERSTPANPTPLSTPPVDTPATSPSIPKLDKTSQSALARQQRIGFITAIIGSMVTLSGFFLPNLPFFGDSFVALFYGYASSLGLRYSAPVYVYLALFLGATVLVGSQLFNSPARRRKSVGRFLIAFGWLEIIFFQLFYSGFNTPANSVTFFWGAGVLVSQLGMLLTIAGGIVAQTDQWSLLTLQQRVGFLVAWISRGVAVVAFSLPYFYIVDGTRFSHSQVYSGVAILIILSTTLFLLEPAVTVVALFVSRKLLIAIGAIGVVLHLWLMLIVLNYVVMQSYVWEGGAYLYLLGMIGLIVGGVLTMKIRKRPLTTASTKVR